jgi:hypothetical protein
MSTYNYTPGLGNAASFQVSGVPYVTGALDLSSGNVSLTFPSVTSWISISVADQAVCHVGFSLNGVLNANKFTIQGAVVTPKFDIKATQLHLSGASGAVSVMAGLTHIQNEKIDNIAVSPSGSNWSGSLNALVG